MSVYAMNSSYVDDPDAVTDLVVEYDPALNTHVVPGVTYTGNLIMNAYNSYPGAEDDLTVRVTINA